MFTTCFSSKDCLLQVLLAFQITKQNLFASLIGEGNFKSVQGVVTSYSGNYGWIESLISSDAEVLTGDVPLRVQQTVTTHVEFQNAGGLNATKVRSARI